MATYRGAVATITHDRYLIDRIANEIFELEDGKIEVYPGNYTAYVETKIQRRERALQLRELQEREYKKLKASAEQPHAMGAAEPQVRVAGREPAAKDGRGEGATRANGGAIAHPAQDRG